MAETSLTRDEVRVLVLDAAKSVPSSLDVKQADVVEALDSVDKPALFIQLSAVRGADRRANVESRMRLSQAIRDRLLRAGDERYPFLSVYAPEEWDAREHA